MRPNPFEEQAADTGGAPQAEAPENAVTQAVEQQQAEDTTATKATPEEAQKQAQTITQEADEQTVVASQQGAELQQQVGSNEPGTPQAETSADEQAQSGEAQSRETQEDIETQAENVQQEEPIVKTEALPEGAYTDEGFRAPPNWRDVVRRVLEQVQGLVQRGVSGAAGILQRVGSTLRRVLSSPVRAVRQVLQTISTTIGGLVRSTGSGLSSMFQSVAGRVTQIANGIRQAVSGLVGRALSLFGNVAERVRSTVSAFLRRAYRIGITIVRGGRRGVVGAVQSVIRSIVRKVRRAGLRLRQAIRGVATRIVAAIRAVRDRVRALIEGALSSGETIPAAIASWLRRQAQNLVGPRLQQLAGLLGQGARNALSNARTILTGIMAPVSTAWQGARTFFRSILGPAVQVAQEHVPEIANELEIGADQTTASAESLRDAIENELTLTEAEITNRVATVETEVANAANV